MHTALIALETSPTPLLSSAHSAVLLFPTSILKPVTLSEALVIVNPLEKTVTEPSAATVKLLDSMKVLERGRRLCRSGEGEAPLVAVSGAGAGERSVAQRHM